MPEAPTQATPDQYMQALQQSMRETKVPVVDQQEVIASQKNMAVTLEALEVGLGAANAPEPLIKLVSDAREQAQLTNETLAQLKDALQYLADAQVTRGEEIRDTMSRMISTSEDEAIQTRMSILAGTVATQEGFSQYLKSSNEALKDAQEQRLFDEDEKRQDDMKKAGLIDRFFGWADDLFKLLKDWIDDMMPTWIDLLKIAWALFAPQLLNIGKYVVESIPRVLEGWVWGPKILEAAKNLPGLFRAIGTEFGKMPGRIVKIVDALKAIPSKIGNAVKALQKAFKGSNTYKALQEISESFRNSKVGKGLASGMQKAGEFASKAGTAIKDKAVGTVTKAVDLAKSFGTAIKESKAFKTLESVILGAINLFKSLGTKISNGISGFVNMIKAVATTIKSVISTALKPIKTFLKPLTDAVKWVAGAFAKLGKAVGQDILNIVKALAPKISGGVKTAAKGISKLSGPVSKLANMFKSAAGTLTKILKPAFSVLGKVRPLTKFFLNALKLVGRGFGFIMPIIDAFIGFFRTETTEKGLKGVFDRLRGAISNVVKGFLDIGAFVLNLPLMLLALFPPLKDWAEEHMISESDTAALGAASTGMKAVEIDGKTVYMTQKAYNKKVAKGEIPSQKGDGDGELGSAIMLGDALATSANTGKHGTGFGASLGKCGLYVGNAVERVLGKGVASQLRGNGKDWATNLSKPIGKKYFDYIGTRGNGQLANLPKGSILSWPASPGHPYGHVEISDGGNNLISDMSRPASSILYRNMQPGLKAHVFAPKGSVDSSKIVSVSSPLSTNYSSASSSSIDASSLDASGIDESTISTIEQKPYTFNDALEDMIKAASSMSNDANDAIYGKYSGASSSPDKGTQSASESAQPVIVAPADTRAPLVDDIALIQQQMALPVT